MKKKFEEKELTLVQSLREKELELQSLIKRNIQPVEREVSLETANEINRLLEIVRGLEGDKSRLSAFNLQYRSQVENLKSEIKEMQERISSEEKRKK